MQKAVQESLAVRKINKHEILFKKSPWSFQEVVEKYKEKKKKCLLSI